MNKPLRLSSQFSDEPKPTALSNGGRRSNNATAWLLLGGFVLIIVVGTLYFAMRKPIDDLTAENAYVRGQNQIFREQQAIAPTPTAVPTLTPTPQVFCDDYSGEIGSLQQLVMHGKFAMATELANVELDNTKLPPCPAAKESIAELGYSATLDDLFATRGLDGRTALLRWADAESKADANHIPFAKRWPPLTVVTQAYNAGYWELGRAAFRQAWNSGTVDHTDAKSLQLYFALNRNWGYALAAGSDAAAQHDGYVLLRTADAISRAYGLTNGEARQDLFHFLGTDEKQWPAADTTDPILAAYAKGDR